jgi:hypothetical protein
MHGWVVSQFEISGASNSGPAAVGCARMSRMKYMRIAALLLALLTIVASMVGIVFPDSVTTLRRLYYTQGGLWGRCCSRSHGASADRGCLELSLAQDPAGGGGGDVLARACREPPGTRSRARNPRMGGASYGALAGWGRGGFGRQWLRRVRAFNEAVRRTEEISSLAFSNRPTTQG